MLSLSKKHDSLNCFSTILLFSFCVSQLLCLSMLASHSMAQVPSTAGELLKIPTREIRVPFDDLPILLGGSNQRMFMTRTEYDELLKKANISPEQIATARQQQFDENAIPTNVVMLDALHSVTIETGRAVIQSDIAIEALKPGLQSIHLALQHVGLLEATIDGEPALLSPTLAPNQPGTTLFLKSKGLHRLRLKMVAAVATSAAQQTLTIGLPHAATNKWTMGVPGNVEILSGASVRSRVVDPTTNRTLFDWLPARVEGMPRQSPVSIVMTLNNKMLRETRALEARSFLSTEITEAYEQVTQRILINVLNGAESKFQITIPDGFEVRKVQSALLSRWNIIEKDGADRGNDQILAIELREPVVDQVALDIVASKPARGRFTETPTTWTWPAWNVLEAQNQTAILAINLEHGLRMHSLEYGKLIPVDAIAFADSGIPAEMDVREPTAPQVRPVATLYAPDASQNVQSLITKPKSTTKASFNALTIVGESGVQSRALVDLETGTESLADFEVSLPAGWRLRAAFVSGIAVPFETLNSHESKANGIEPSGPNLTRVRLARPFAPNSVNQIVLECTIVPKGWLSTWSEQPFSFPTIGIVGAETGLNVLSTMAEGDFAIDVSKAENLIALFESERITLKIQGDGSGPSYSVEGNKWSLDLLAKRKKPEITAEVFSFFKIESEGIRSAFELHFEIKQATTDSLEFSLPDTTPTELSIQGLDAVVVKESTSRLEDGKRIWSIKLASRVTGVAKLHVDFIKNLETAVDLLMPIAKVSNTTYQTGVIAIEGDDELEVSVLQHPRVADVGELTASNHSVGSRLVGVYGYSVGLPGAEAVSIRATRRELQSVPATIVERAELSTALSAHGASYHFAELHLKTTGGFIQAKLPANAVLWSITLNGLPTLPQRLDDQLLIELRAIQMGGGYGNSVPSSGAQSDANLHVLRIAYETPIKAIEARSDVELVAPRLATMQTSTSPSTPIPTADLLWKVWAPGNLSIVDSNGDVKLSESGQPSSFPGSIFGVSSFPFNLLPVSRSSSVAQSVRARIMLDSSGPEAAASSGPAKGFNWSPIVAEGSRPVVKKNKSTANEVIQGTLNSNEIKKPPFYQNNLLGDAFDDSSQAAGANPIVPDDVDDLFGPSAQQPQVASVSAAGGNVFSNPKSLDGLRTLPVEFQSPNTWQSFEMDGFGDSLKTTISVVNNERVHWIASALSALLIAFGLATLGNPFWTVLRWSAVIVCFAIAASLLSPWEVETAILASGCFNGAMIVLAIRTLFLIIQPVVRGIKRIANAFVMFGLILVLAVGDCAEAQEIPLGKDIRSIDDLIATLRLNVGSGNRPIEIPADAILVPYQRTQPPLSDATEKILVPYSTYSQLMEIANPNKATVKPLPPPFDYSLSNLSYKATLDRDDALSLSLSVDVTPHTERGILIPFGFAGAVLTSAKLNDVSASVSSGPNGLALLVTGIRSHTFTATFQLPIQRQGGWRIVNATLPTAPSGQTQLVVPAANTEVRFLGLPDAEQRESTHANEVITTSVAPDGKFSLQWRPKVSESVSDQGLSVNAECSLAVEERGLHAVWDVKLEFRRGRRELFDFELPKDVNVERVSGKNIRGWTIDTASDKQIVKVTLLKSAVESEQLSIVASLPMRLDSNVDVSAIVPRLQVPEAMLQRGKITILRSKLLELEVAKSDGLVREDLLPNNQTVATNSPVPLFAFQTYRYGSMDFQLGLKVHEATNKVKSQFETSLRVSRNDARLQCQVHFVIENRPMFRTRLEVPEDWKWEAPESDAQMEWTLSEPKDGVRVFDFLFLKGQIGNTFIRLNAMQNRTNDLQSTEYVLPVPKIRPLDASSEQGDIIIDTDAGVDVRTEQLVGCERVGSPAVVPQNPNFQTAPSPRPRAVLRCATKNYEGQLRFQSRTPQITAISISNVKVTRRSMEETLYFGWEIKEAGVHRFEFTVPARLKDAVILAQMVRSIQRTPTSEQLDAPVKCIVDLQEDVMGEYRILLQKDSPLPSVPQSVPIPVILTGNVENRFVTLENSGRDELVVDSLKGITQLVRGDSLWVRLQSLLGGKSADVYRVDERLSQLTGSAPTAANEPSLLFKPQLRMLVETASARIGLAQCTLSVDEMGNYRAMQELRVENTSEAYLELEMPDGAQLWTAIVAGTPVKPIQSSNKPKRAGATRFRLPLVRTQTGDLDYGVELKYAGKMKKSGFMTQLDFPLIESVNINVELSQVKLLLPENQYWYGFGGTLGQVRDESDFLAGWLSHKNKQIGRLSELTTKDSEVFSKARAEENLKQLGSEVKQQLGNARFDLNSNSSLQEQVMQNDKVSNQALAQIAKSEAEVVPKAALDNRGFLNGLLDSQNNYRANGNVDQTRRKGGNSEAAQSSLSQSNVQQAIPAKPIAPQIAGQMPAISAADLNGNSFFYQGKGAGNKPQEQGNLDDNSNDTQGLASRYKNKLQQQSSVQTVRSFNNIPMASPVVPPAGPGGFGGGSFGGRASTSNSIPQLPGGMESGSGGMGGMGMSSGASSSSTRGNEGFDVIPQMTVQNEWQNGGNSLPSHSGPNLSFALAALQENHQAYMKSLEINLPTRGTEFYFTTPRGDAVLSASGVSKSIVPKSIGLLALVIGIALLVRKKSDGRPTEGSVKTTNH